MPTSRPIRVDIDATVVQVFAYYNLALSRNIGWVTAASQAELRSKRVRLPGWAASAARAF
jgi:hypothetical protein